MQELISSTTYCLQILLTVVSKAFRELSDLCMKLEELSTEVELLPYPTNQCRFLGLNFERWLRRTVGFTVCNQKN